MQYLIPAAIIAILSAWWFGDRNGYARAETVCEQTADRATAAQALAERVRGRAARDAEQEAQAGVQDDLDRIRDRESTDREEIRYVYRDRIVTVPVAAGACVHPVDDRVQDAIDAAVAAARAADRPLPARAPAADR